MSLSLGEAIRQVPVKPQKDGGRREHGQKEGGLCPENRPEDIKIADGRKPKPINQQIPRDSEHDEASCDDDHRYYNGSPRHIAPQSRPSSGTRDRVALRGKLSWAGEREGVPFRPILAIRREEPCRVFFLPPEASVCSNFHSFESPHRRCRRC